MEEQSSDHKQKQTVRGKDQEDPRFFSNEAMEKLRYAQEELRFLMDRNYSMTPIIKLVGDRYQFSTRQRLALQRSTCKTKSLQIRKKKSLSFNSISEGPIYIDGFNLIITLEVALSGGLILLGQDGATRDLAGLRGTYRLIDKTDEALKLLGRAFEELKAKGVHFYLDAPVSNSGRLKVKILEYAKKWNFTVEVSLVNNPDTILSNMNRIVTTDAIILDNCESYFNLAAYCIQTYLTDAFVIDLSR